MAKPSKKLRFPETPVQRGERMAALNTEWRIEVPYYPRLRHGVFGTELQTNHYPPQEVTPYSYDQAYLLLQTFCQRYTDNGQLPPPELEPVAIEINIQPTDKYGRPRPLARFTLKEVDPYVAEWADPLPPAPREEPEDDADRWLREHAA